MRYVGPADPLLGDVCKIGHRLFPRNSRSQADLHMQAFVCHIGFVSEGQPFVIPTGYARDGDTLYIHGSVGSKMLRALESGAGETANSPALLAAQFQMLLHHSDVESLTLIPL